MVVVVWQWCGAFIITRPHPQRHQAQGCDCCPHHDAQQPRVPPYTHQHYAHRPRCTWTYTHLLLVPSFGVIGDYFLPFPRPFFIFICS